VKAESVEEMKNALTRLCEKDLRKNIGAQGKISAEKLFSIERMVGEYEQILR
jgi:glycosyltransferase involved in cell wall biosynthesis